MRTYFGQIADQKYSNKENVEYIFNLLVQNIGNIKEGSNILLAFLGHPKYYKLALERFPNCKISILEDISLKQGYDFCSYISKSDIIYIDFNDEKYLYYIENLYKLNMGFKDKKFDIVVGNPPYDKNLHLKIIEKAFTLLNENGKGCFVHPHKWFTLPYRQLLVSTQNNFYDKYSSKIENVTIYNAKETNELFGIGSYDGVGIFVYSNNNLNKYSSYKDNLVDSILNKILSKNLPSFRSKFKKPKMELTKYFIKICRRNHLSQDWFSDNAVEGIFFDSNEELNNFINSTKTWVYKYFNYHNDDNSAHMPFMIDYSHNWTDEDMFNFFEITDDEKKIIYERIKTITWKR